MDINIWPTYPENFCQNFFWPKYGSKYPTWTYVQTFVVFFGGDPSLNFWYKNFWFPKKDKVRRNLGPKIFLKVCSVVVVGWPSYFRFKHKLGYVKFKCSWVCDKIVSFHNRKNWTTSWDKAVLANNPQSLVQKLAVTVLKSCLPI